MWRLPSPFTVNSAPNHRGFDRERLIENRLLLDAGRLGDRIELIFRGIIETDESRILRIVRPAIINDLSVVNPLD